MLTIVSCAIALLSLQSASAGSVARRADTSATKDNHVKERTYGCGNQSGGGKNLINASIGTYINCNNNGFTSPPAGFPVPPGGLPGSPVIPTIPLLPNGPGFIPGGFGGFDSPCATCGGGFGMGGGGFGTGGGVISSGGGVISSGGGVISSGGGVISSGDGMITPGGFGVGGGFGSTMMQSHSEQASSSDSSIIMAKAAKKKSDASSKS